MDPRSVAGHRVRDAVSVLTGFPIGVLSGFTGVGGGEYRAPILLALLHDVHRSVAGNLLAGAIVSATIVGSRGGLGLPSDALALALLMIASGVPGGYIGAIVARRTPPRWLKILLTAVLVATGLRLIVFETLATERFVLGVVEAVLALGIGFALGIVSGLLGLAGGEYRIPALILIFGLPTILAGTVSSLVALPQLAVAFEKHRRLGHGGSDTLRTGFLMGVSAAIGVLLGVLLLGRTEVAFVTAVLGLAMITAGARIAWEARKRGPETRSARAN